MEYKLTEVDVKNVFEQMIHEGIINETPITDEEMRFIFEEVEIQIDWYDVISIAIQNLRKNKGKENGDVTKVE